MHFLKTAADEHHKSGMMTFMVALYWSDQENLYSHYWIVNKNFLFKKGGTMLHYAENKADRLEYDLGVYTKTLNFCLSNNENIFFFSQTIYLAIEVIHIDQPDQHRIEKNSK